MIEPCTTAAKTVDALIGATAVRAADAVAVRWGGGTRTGFAGGSAPADGDGRDQTHSAALTYAELDAASERVAAGLAARGVKAGAVVGLCLQRGVEQVVALLGILRAGAAVLPLDASYPQELLAFMVADAAAALVVTDRGMSGAGRVDIEELSGAIAESSVGHSVRSGSPEELCYVLYTSGSTGRPKGVAMPHRAVVNLIEWQRAAMPLATAGARVLQFAPLSFDVSFQEIFSTWAEGGTLVLIDDDARRDPRALWRVIADDNVERVFLPYVALQALAEQAPEELPDSLRDVITAGEQLRITPQIRSLFSRMPKARLHNHYGPTETHVCTAHSLGGDPAEWPSLPPIGEPIARTKVQLLDAQRKSCTEGELYVGGACVAAGYLRRDDLTGQRFVMLEGERFYRTGDLARQREDGLLEYLGRADDQLKVRGFRIEPGEIEAQLSHHPAVRECAVTARDQRLLAYWVGESVAHGELREFLASRLAAHLIPAFYTRLETMPLTPSGKIDRRALPEPEIPAEYASHARPASEMESRVARIWCEVLRLPTVPRDVNFGDLGGTSLHAAEAQAMLGRELQRELAVTQLYEHPTVAALARALEGNGAEATLSERTQTRAAAQRAAARANTARRKRQPADA